MSYTDPRSILTRTRLKSQTGQANVPLAVVSRDIVEDRDSGNLVYLFMRVTIHKLDEAFG